MAAPVFSADFSTSFANLNVSQNTGRVAGARIAPTTLTGGKTPVTAYRRQGESEADVTARVILLGKCLEFDTAQMTTGAVTSWIWTSAEALCPGITELCLPEASFSLTWHDVTDANMVAIVPSFPHGQATAPTAAELHANFGNLGRLATPALANPVIGGMILGLYIFSIAKTPTAENLTAFTDRRPNAVLRKAGLDPAVTLQAVKNHLPTVPRLLAYSGYFNMRPAVREQFTKEVVRWIAGAPTLAAESVVTHVKLWRNAGLTHLFLVRNFVRHYGDQIAKIRPLLSEVEAAGSAWKGYVDSTDEFKDYSRVIYGDRAHFGESKDYQNLLILARDIAKRADPKMGNYAKGLVESPFLTQFESLCAADHVYVVARPA